MEEERDSCVADGLVTLCIGMALQSERGSIRRYNEVQTLLDLYNTSKFIYYSLSSSLPHVILRCFRLLHRVIVPLRVPLCP